MKMNRWSIRYQALQKADPLSGVKRNLRPLQVYALLLAPRRERSTHELSGRAA